MKKLAVIGIGRLGLCFALNAERVGYEIVGVDINHEYVNQLNQKAFSSPEPHVDEYLSASTRFRATNDFSVIDQEAIEYIYIIVPTPSLPDATFSHQYIDEVINQLCLLPTPKNQKHIIIGSTVMPGYCDQLIVKLKSLNYSISYNPEFIAQGSIIHDQQYPDQILIGEGHPKATEFLKKLYGKMCLSHPDFHVMDRISAEITKLATNCFLTMKISFANSIGDLVIQSGGEVEKVLSAIGADSRIGNKYLKYGFGFGGPCFPRDNQALLKYAEQKDTSLPLSQATIEVNNKHLYFQLNELLAENKDTYVFDSVSYKKGTDILEESQQLKLAVELAKKGKRVIVKESTMVRGQLEKFYPNLFVFE